MAAGTTPNIGSFDTDRLGSWLAENVPDYDGPLEIQKFQGGQSNPTYRASRQSPAPMCFGENHPATFCRRPTP